MVFPEPSIHHLPLFSIPLSLSLCIYIFLSIYPSILPSVDIRWRIHVYAKKMKNEQNSIGENRNCPSIIIAAFCPRTQCSRIYVTREPYRNESRCWLLVFSLFFYRNMIAWWNSLIWQILYRIFWEKKISSIISKELRVSFYEKKGKQQEQKEKKIRRDLFTTRRRRQSLLVIKARTASEKLVVPRYTLSIFQLGSSARETFWKHDSKSVRIHFAPLACATKRSLLFRRSCTKISRTSFLEAGYLLNFPSFELLTTFPKLQKHERFRVTLAIGCRTIF